MPITDHVEHLDPEQIGAGDRVIGTLPIHLAARVCERGASFWFLSMELPRALRGTELSAGQIAEMGARLERYEVCRVMPEGDSGPRLA